MSLLLPSSFPAPPTSFPPPSSPILPLPFCPPPLLPSLFFPLFCLFFFPLLFPFPLLSLLILYFTMQPRLVLTWLCRWLQTGDPPALYFRAVWSHAAPHLDFSNEQGQNALDSDSWGLTLSCLLPPLGAHFTEDPEGNSADANFSAQKDSARYLPRDNRRVQRHSFPGGPGPWTCAGRRLPLLSLSLKKHLAIDLYMYVRGRTLVCVCVDTKGKPWVLYLRSHPHCLLRQSLSLSLACGSPSNLNSQTRDLKKSTSPIEISSVHQYIWFNFVWILGFSLSSSCWQGTTLPTELSPLCWETHYAPVMAVILAGQHVSLALRSL